MFKRWLGVILIVPMLALGVWTARSIQARAAASPSASLAPVSSAPVSTAEYREVTIPAGTVLRLRLDTPVASDRSRAEDPVQATLRTPVAVNGVAAVPAGSAVLGNVIEARRPGKVKWRGHIALRFHTLKVGSEQYTIRTGMVGRTAPATKKKDALQIGIPAAGGAVVGGIVGGKKGAAIGAAAGGGAGTAYVFSTRGKEARLGPGALLTVRLTEPITVRVPAHS